MKVIYDPFIMLDAYWTEEQVEGSGLHLGFWIFNLGGIYILYLTIQEVNIRTEESLPAITVFILY